MRASSNASPGDSKGGSDKPIVVAGAGPAGLFVAWKLAQQGQRVIVLERESIVGGLAARVHIGENDFSYGTHHIHSPDPEQLKPFQELMGAKLLELQRKLEIKFMGRFYPYPLRSKDLLLGMPPALMVSSLLSLGRSLVASRFTSARPANAEQAIIALYGRRLYDVMFHEYTERFWGMPVEQISTTFVEQRMPGINAIEKFKQVLSRLGAIGKDGLGKTAVIGSGAMFTTAKGVGPVFEEMAGEVERLGGEVRTDGALMAVKTEDGRVSAVVHESASGPREIACHALVSTIPLTHLARSLTPLPPAAVLSASSRLTFRALLAVALVVRPKRRLQAMFTYFPDRIFHRLSELGSPVANVSPGGATILLAELTCDVGDALWQNPSSIEQQVIDDVVAEGLADRDGILEVHYLRTPQAYPRYELGFEASLQTLQEHLAQFPNLVSTGRQGTFQFTSAIPAMSMAWKHSKEMLARSEL